VYIYIYVYVCKCIYTHINMCIYISVFVCICMYMYVCMHLHMYTYIHWLCVLWCIVLMPDTLIRDTYKCIYIYIYIYVYICICIHMHVYACAYAYTHIHLYTLALRVAMNCLDAWHFGTVFIWMCIFLHIYIYVYVCICMCVCIYTYIHWIRVLWLIVLMPDTFGTVYGVRYSLSPHMLSSWLIVLMYVGFVTHCIHMCGGHDSHVCRMKSFLEYWGCRTRPPGRTWLLGPGAVLVLIQHNT